MNPTDDLVSAQWLAANLDTPQVVIIDCRFSLIAPELGRQQYAENHIPGAFYFDLNQDLSSPVQQHGGRHPLPHPDELGQKLAAVGVNFQETLVVIYDDSRFAFAARLWWLLDYMGHKKAAILDGGFTGWKTAGYPVTNALSVAQQPGVFVPQLHPEKVVDIHVVKSRKDLPGVVLIDSRERERYLGNHEPIDPVAGHIPGAVNYPWQEVSDEQGKVRDSIEQGRRWQDIAAAEDVIVYCGSGVTACVNLWSLKMAGISAAKLYAGSWSDWCSYL